MNEIAAAKTLARSYWAASDTADTGALSRLMAEEFLWEGPWPAKEARSISELNAVWLAPLNRAFPDMQRQFHILTAGRSNGHSDGSPDGALWVAGTGYLVGQPVAEMLGIPVANHPLRLRWGEFLRVEHGRITEVQINVDLVDWFEQIGRPVLPRPKGVPHVWPAATGFDAVMTGDADPNETDATMNLGRGLLFGGLNGFDETDLASMGMAQFFHPNLKWYGPGGIGACLSLTEFEDLHQRPWLVAFPDRKVQDLRCLMAEGPILSSSGQCAVIATHTGPYQDVPASGARIEFSGLDFWLRSDAQFTENWVFVDMVKLFSQMGVDLMDRMRNAQ